MFCRPVGACPQKLVVLFCVVPSLHYLCGVELRPTRKGGIAQLGEHLHRTQKVVGSSPITSTIKREFCDSPDRCPAVLQYRQPLGFADAFVFLKRESNLPLPADHRGPHPRRRMSSPQKRYFAFGGLMFLFFIWGENYDKVQLFLILLTLSFVVHIFLHMNFEQRQQCQIKY